MYMSHPVKEFINTHILYEYNFIIAVAAAPQLPEEAGIHLTSGHALNSGYSVTADQHSRRYLHYYYGNTNISNLVNLSKLSEEMKRIHPLHDFFLPIIDEVSTGTLEEHQNTSG
jgi:hypothetical protein